jgi:hypothetical protein
VIEPVWRCLDQVAETVTQGGLCQKERKLLEIVELLLRVS